MYICTQENKINVKVLKIFKDEIIFEKSVSCWGYESQPDYQPHQRGELLWQNCTILPNHKRVGRLLRSN